MISNEKALKEVKAKFKKHGIYELVECKGQLINGDPCYKVKLIESGLPAHNWQRPALIQDIWFNEVFI